jgi:hypothetical protein
MNVQNLYYASDLVKLNLYEDWIQKKSTVSSWNVDDKLTNTKFAYVRLSENLTYQTSKARIVIDPTY